jgi:predicted transcriptional regulator
MTDFEKMAETRYKITKKGICKYENWGKFTRSFLTNVDAKWGMFDFLYKEKNRSITLYELAYHSTYDINRLQNILMQELLKDGLCDIVNQ